MDRKFVKIIKMITISGFHIQGPILGPILGLIVGPIVHLAKQACVDPRENSTFDLSLPLPPPPSAHLADTSHRPPYPHCINRAAHKGNTGQPTKGIQGPNRALYRALHRAL